MIPFNRPYVSGDELPAIADAVFRAKLSGDGYYTSQVTKILKDLLGVPAVLLTQSCTAALEVAALLIDAGPGDEIIMPSFTFVSTANAFVLRGATPVFVDVREDDLNIDENLVRRAITAKTKAIVPVHYGGVGCNMDALVSISADAGAHLIEDAAQALFAKYKGKPLGTFGSFATFSFHETKNVISGEGGAIVINDPKYIQRAEIIREKGTNRSRYYRGEVDKYTWVDVGSSYLPSEITAAFLWAQLRRGQDITERRRSIWRAYHAAFGDLELLGKARRPVVPLGCDHNAHLYYLLVGSAETRDSLIADLNSRGINAVFHYVPLHSSDFGRLVGRAHGDLCVTEGLAERLVRLPLWVGVEEHQDKIVSAIYEFFGCAWTPDSNAHERPCGIQSS